MDDIIKDWGKDKLSEYIENARHNVFATFTNLNGTLELFQNINGLFCKLTDSIHNSKDWMPAFFLLRAHASYLAAVQLAASGQIPEAYMVLRGCLESALYGYYVFKKPGTFKTWIDRQDNEKTKNSMRNEFRISNIFKMLEKYNSKVFSAVEYLYGRTIDYGAHPNVDSILTLLRREEKDGYIKFDLKYLDGNSSAHALSLKTTAQIGICSLTLFRLIYKERFEILGISDKIDQLTRSCNL